MKSFRVEKNKSYKETEGISSTELEGRKADGECLCCAWPSDRKGIHQVKDCRRPIKLDNGTAKPIEKTQYNKQYSLDEE